MLNDSMDIIPVALQILSDFMFEDSPTSDTMVTSTTNNLKDMVFSITNIRH
jgi:hypothetical protein